MKFIKRIAIIIPILLLICAICYNNIPVRIERTLTGRRFAENAPSSARETIVIIDGNIYRKLFGDVIFKGSITFDGRKLENSNVVLSNFTPALSYL